MKQKTLIIVKPDGVLRGLTGEVISRIERKGLKILAAKFTVLEKAVAEKHYAEHSERPFFANLVSFIISAPVMLLVVEGNSAIPSVRNLVGSTNGTEAAPGTIRGDFGSSRSFNIIHASDSPEASQREIGNFFADSEITNYELPPQNYLFEENE
jgi:nucleoside-diphosphate kinase